MQDARYLSIFASMETPKQTQGRWDCDMTHGINLENYNYITMLSVRNKQRRTFRKGMFLGLLIGIVSTLSVVLLTGGIK